MKIYSNTFMNFSAVNAVTNYNTVINPFPKYYAARVSAESRRTGHSEADTELDTENKTQTDAEANTDKDMDTDTERVTETDREPH